MTTMREYSRTMSSKNPITHSIRPLSSLEEGGLGERKPVATLVDRWIARKETGAVPFRGVRRALPRDRSVTRQCLGALGLITLAGLSAAAAQATDTNPDIGPMCGTKPMIVGLSDGYGGNTWRKTALEELKNELSHCTNVTRFIYSNANGDPQKASSDINSMVAQGANVLIVDPDFGPSQIPSMRSPAYPHCSVRADLLI